MEPSVLQRLAVQVHTSIARAIQPFSTVEDGDTLFAVSTQERLSGSYRLGDSVVIDVWEQDGALMLRTRGEIWFFDLSSQPTKLTATSDTDFYVNSQYRTRLSFVVPQKDRATGVVVNPGGWALQGQRISDSKH